MCEVIERRKTPWFMFLIMGAIVGYALAPWVYSQMEKRRIAKWMEQPIEPIHVEIATWPMYEVGDLK